MPNNVGVKQSTDRKITSSTHRIRAINRFKSDQEIKSFTPILTNSPTVQELTPRINTIASRFRIQQKENDKMRTQKIEKFFKKQKNYSIINNNDEQVKQQNTPNPKKLFKNLNHNENLYFYLDKLNKSPIEFARTQNQIQESEHSLTQRNITAQKIQKSQIQEGQEPIGAHLFFYQKQNQNSYQRSRKQMRTILKRNLFKLRQLNISPRYLIDTKVFPKRPYENEVAKTFIHAVKTQQKDQIINLLSKNRFLVFHFDYYNMTGLHWSTKKGYLEITKILLEHGADVDGVDVLGRNAMYHAIENDHFEIVVVCKILLYHNASPWSGINEFGALLENKTKIKSVITMARRIDIACNLSPVEIRQEIIQKHKNSLLCLI